MAMKVKNSNITKLVTLVGTLCSGTMITVMMTYCAKMMRMYL